MEWLKGKKTYIVAGVMVIYALVIIGWNGGDWGEAYKLILEATGIGTLRAGIAKV